MRDERLMDADPAKKVDAKLALASFKRKQAEGASPEQRTKLLEKIPNGATSAGMAVDQGFAKREGENLVSRIEFSKGELTVNGKPLPIPGLGAPSPPQDGYPAEEAPPEE